MDTAGEQPQGSAARGGSGWVTLVFVVAGALAVIVGNFTILRAGRPALGGDAYEYAQVARNVAARRGLVTDAVTTFEVSRLGARLPLPYFVHDPGTSLLLGSFFWVFGPSALVVVMVSAGCFVLTVALTYKLGEHLYGFRAGCAAAFLAAVSPQLNAIGLSGLSEAPAALLFALLFFLLLSCKRPWAAFAAGLAAGALVIVRQNALPFLPWLLGFLLLAPEGPASSERPSQSGPVGAIWKIRLRRLVLPFAGGFGLFFLANAARTARQFGHPLHGLGWDSTWLCDTGAMTYSKAGGIWLTRGLSVDPMKYLRAHPGELLAKMHYQLSDIVSRLLEGRTPHGAWDAVLAGLVVLALVFPPRAGARTAALRWLFSACLGTALVVGSAAFIRFRHLYLFLPMAFVFAAEILLRIAEGTEVSRGMARVRALALAAFVGGAGILGILPQAAEMEGAFDASARGIARFVDRFTPKDAIVLVETRPVMSLHALAWYTRREYVWYSDETARQVEAAAGGRPVFALSAAAPPRGRAPLEGLGPGPSEGFYPVARIDDPGAGIAARLRVLR